VPGHDKASALAAIELFLHEEARAGRRCLLVVDEAQNLSIGALEELRMLSNFQLGAHPLLQMLLLGQPEFRTLLQTSPELEQLRQRVIASHHLDAMEAGEVGPYIEHHLARVGWTGNPAFEPRVYADLAGKRRRAAPDQPDRQPPAADGRDRAVPRIDSAMLKDVLTDLDRDAAGGAVARSRPRRPNRRWPMRCRSWIPSPRPNPRWSTVFSRLAKPRPRRMPSRRSTCR
jgi:hypothetical protein